ncbi:hypothetical protein JTE90_003616 [Oedothorax gibbosus]|uniref:C2HC/C3H-type domain-containing protein n=1 Tax=Oedothorax gibbosus TaxID=931172 RepID=A0AAV6VDM5_9ARAC|nr:hypothetical protein JTE90_003616 [Oedothorax gibbosus]
MSSKKTVECRNCGESVYSENVADHECYFFENGNKLIRNSVPPTVEKETVIKTELKITKIVNESVNTASEEGKGISTIQNSIKQIMDMNKRRFPGNKFSRSTKGYYENKDTDLTEQSTISNGITELEISDQNLNQKKDILSEIQSEHSETGIQESGMYYETPNQYNEKGLKDDDQYPPLSTQSVSSDYEASKPQISKTLPLNAQLKDEPKQAWNANLKGKVSGKVKGPEPTKRYRHYPVSCEFCNKKFQPSALAKHIREEHPDENLEPSMRGSYPGLNHEKPQKGGKKKEPKAGVPKQLKICYICGRMYGSQSLKIHEPKCLEKWRIENERLPEHKQMPEPIKPETHKGTDPGRSLPQTKGYNHNLPDLNPEAEAAYQCHLRNLVPCDFCGRTFNPDRVMVHEKACVERPEKKKGKIASE